MFSTFEKIHCFFINNLKSQETKSQMKVHLSYLANSYFYNYKPSPRNGKFYNQIDGVAMGSPLDPVVANIFMGFYESIV